MKNIPEEENIELRIRIRDLERELSLLKSPGNYKSNIEAARRGVENNGALIKDMASGLNDVLKTIYKEVKKDDKPSEKEERSLHFLKLIYSLGIIDAAIERYEDLASVTISPETSMVRAIDGLGVKLNLEKTQNLKKTIFKFLQSVGES